MRELGRLGGVRVAVDDAWVGWPRRVSAGTSRLHEETEERFGSCDSEGTALRSASVGTWFIEQAVYTFVIRRGKIFLFGYFDERMPLSKEDMH